jgi:hypothetical protein
MLELIRAAFAVAVVGTIVFFIASLPRARLTTVCREYEVQLVWHLCATKPKQESISV